MPRAAIRANTCRALLVVLVGCAPPPPDPPNLLLVVVDTLRADRVGCYGAERDTSPGIDALAQRSVRFENAYAAAPWTSPSVASILTGLAPSSHGLVGARDGLSDDVPTLAELLRSHGYRTAGIVSNPHLAPKFGFAQGFDVYLDSEARDHAWVSSPGVTAQAVDLLSRFAKAPDPFFLFALYFDPHYDYQRHDAYGFAMGESGRIQGGESIARLRELAPSMTAEELRFLRDVYDEEVRFTDDWIAALLDGLRSCGLEDETIVVLTADHGEEFLERGWLGHVRTLYDELTRAPLLVHDPRWPGPSVVDTPVSLASIAPTVLELCDLPVPPGLSAPSLVPLFDGRAPRSWPPAFAEVEFVPTDPKNAVREAHLRAIRRGDHKLLHDDVTGGVELFDLSVDPEERVDLAPSHPELVEELRALLEAHRLATQAQVHARRSVPLTAAEQQAMRDLGYVDD